MQLLWDDADGCTTCPFGGGPAKFNNMFYQHSLPRSRVSEPSRVRITTPRSLACDSARQRLVFRLNYTFSHSLDNASGLQASTAYATAFIVNALEPDQNYATSDFDAKHIINANWVMVTSVWRAKGFFQARTALPKEFLVAGICRDFPLEQWFTNSDTIRRQPLGDKLERPIQWRARAAPRDQSFAWCGRHQPNVFADPRAALASFRNARPVRLVTVMC